MYELLKTNRWEKNSLLKNQLFGANLFALDVWSWKVKIEPIKSKHSEMIKIIPMLYNSGQQFFQYIQKFHGLTKLTSFKVKIRL